MMMMTRHFVSPQNAAEELTLESVKAAFGIANDTPPAGDPPTDPPGNSGMEPPAGDPPDNNGGQANTDPPANDPPATDPPNDPPANDPPQEPNKAGQAFAQMRVQNKQYQQIINGVAKVLGVTDTNNPDAVMASLNDLIIKAEAKNQNIPEEVFRKLQTLEAQQQEFNQQKIREAAYFGFQQVKDTFKLDDAGLGKFADDLLKAGHNPFETPTDLVREYRLMHYDELINKAREEGMRLEAERAAKAANHSSTPNNKQGQGGNDPGKITTVAQLNAWFDKQTAK